MEWVKHIIAFLFYALALIFGLIAWIIGGNIFDTIDDRDCQTESDLFKKYHKEKL